jgi:hypothetical protein
LDRPHWSVEVKGGYFYPELENWEAYYGDDKTWHAAGTVAYKFFRWAEIGVEGGMIRDRGTASAPFNSAYFGTPVTAGEVTYQLFPVSAFVVLRGVFSEQQWLVPYIGGGYTRMHYRVKVEDQGSVRGSADGYNGRAGIQLLLDNLDQKAANNLYMDYGILHTYLFFEAQQTTARVTDVNGIEVDLGGLSYLWGLLFEF